MPSTYSSSLRLELMATGEKSGTWGDITNTNLGTLLEAAIAGWVSVTHDDTANYTLTTANGSADEARNMVLNIAGTLTAARNVVCPTQEKVYIVKNATTGGFAITLKTSGGTGISVPNGRVMILYCDGTNVVIGNDYVDTTYSNTIISTGTTATVFNTVATTVNAFGAATTLTVGAATSGTTWTGRTWTLTGANGTNNTALTVTNTSNTAATAEHSIVDVAVGGATTTGDPQYRLTIPGGTSWYMGVDNSASDAWILGTGAAVGTNPKLTYSGTVFTVNDNLVVSGTGPHAIGGATVSTTAIKLTGAYGTASDRFLSVDGSITAVAANPAYGSVFAVTVTEAGSGNHTELAGVRIANSFTNGAATATTVSQLSLSGVAAPTGSTNAATLYIDAAMSGATNNYALFVDAGDSRFDGGIELQGVLSGASATGIGASGPGGDIRFYAGGTHRMTLSGPILFVNETSNANMTCGITVFGSGGSDDEHFALKNSDVAHGMTTVAETDTFAHVMKANAASGGVLIRGLDGTAVTAAVISGFGGTGDATHTAAGRASVEIYAAKKNGTTVQALGANENLFAVREANGPNTRFIVDFEGDVFADGGGITVYDEHDDLALVRAFDLSRAKEFGGRGVIRSKWDDFVNYNEDTLVDLGILGARRSEGGLINITRLQQLHNGAIWQLGTKVMDHDEQIRLLVAENAMLKSQLARLEARQ